MSVYLAGGLSAIGLVVALVAQYRYNVRRWGK